MHTPTRRARLIVLVGLVMGGVAIAALAVALGAHESGDTSTRTPKPYTLSRLVREHPFPCGRSDERCAHEYLVGLTDEYGPRAALGELRLLQQRERISRSVDDHQLAHAIGRETAKRFGVNAGAFDLCTTDFNYGCVHGFFEYALGRTTTAEQAAVAICDSARRTTLTSRFSCYHGVGHGVMMAKAYDLRSALRTCDSLGDPTAQDGCWQGVFMENVNAAIRNEARAGIFSKADPLSPCTKVAEKYRHECYINHAGWLVHVTGLEIGEATRICLRAPSSDVSACAQSVGLMVTNPSWQASLAPDLVGRPFEQIAWRLCLRFPAQLRRDCVIAGLDNLANFDQLDVTRANRFCTTVAATYRRSCYRQIGLNVSRRSNSLAVVARRCARVASAHRSECLAGAREANLPEAPASAPPSTTTPVPKQRPAETVKGAVVVKMEDNAFSPATVTIEEGHTVAFVNVGQDDKWPASDPHPVHTLYPGLDAGRSIIPGGSWSFTFERRGRWTYHNHLSPDINGTIIVR